METSARTTSSSINELLLEESGESTPPPPGLLSITENTSGYATTDPPGEGSPRHGDVLQPPPLLPLALALALTLEQAKHLPLARSRHYESGVGCIVFPELVSELRQPEEVAFFLHPLYLRAGRSPEWYSIMARPYVITHNTWDMRHIVACRKQTTWTSWNIVIFHL